MGGTGEEQPDGGGTMQLDALVDSMEDLQIPEDLDHAMSAPPPLPPKKASKAMWIIGALVVLVSTGAAVGIGLYMMNSAPDSVAAPEPAATEPAPTEAAEAQAEEPEDPVEETPAEPHVVMDEFVFDHEGEEGGEPEE